MAGCANNAGDGVQPVSPTSIVDAPTTSSGPPALKLTTGNETVALEPFDYCWIDECADSFGGKEPDKATIHSEDVNLEWKTDGTLSASVKGDECTTPLALDEIGVGVWQLAMPEKPGVTLISLSGSAPEGTASFLLEATTAVPGRASTPVVEIGWPVTSDPLSISLNIYGFKLDPSEATLTFESADGTTTQSTLDLVWTEYEPDCPVLFTELDVVDISQLGAPPIETRLHLDKYQAQWIWPDEFDNRDDNPLMTSMTSVHG